MKATVITVTEAARHFADYVNRAHYQEITFVLLKGGRVFARLVPDKEKPSTGRELARALSDVALTKKERTAWRKDLRRAHKTLQEPFDKWQESNE